MTGSTIENGQQSHDDLSVEQFLKYDCQLDGKVFSRNVMAAVERRASWRKWILAGAALLAAATTYLIKPEKISILSNVHFPIEEGRKMAMMLSTEGLMAVLLVSVFLVGIVKTLDSI